MLVGCKCDREHKVTRDEAEAVAAHYNMDYAEVSAKEGIGVREVVEGLARRVFEVIREQELEGDAWRQAGIALHRGAPTR